MLLKVVGSIGVAGNPEKCLLPVEMVNGVALQLFNQTGDNLPALTLRHGSKQ